MRAAMIQMFCAWGDVERNLASMQRNARAAREAGAEIVAFPELTLTGIYKDDHVLELAENLDGPAVRRALAVAQDTGAWLGFGFTERASPLPYNAYAVASPDGTLAGVYRKNFIPKLEVPWWQGHTERPVFEVAGKRTAVAICWDTTCPELLSDYGSRGAEMVLMPHAWDSDPLAADGTDLAHETMAELYEHQRQGRLAGWRSHDEMRDQFYRYIPARARENGFWALFVNQSGQPHPAVKIVGPTFAVTPRGDVAVETRDAAEQMVIVDLV
jgi:predicted amidohydrolase